MSTRHVQKTKYLCPICLVLRPAQTLGDKTVLECGHSRPPLLQKAHNAVSLEDLNTPLGSKWFPQVSE